MQDRIVVKLQDDLEYHILLAILIKAVYEKNYYIDEILHDEYVGTQISFSKSPVNKVSTVIFKQNILRCQINVLKSTFLKNVILDINTMTNTQKELLLYSGKYCSDFEGPNVSYTFAFNKRFNLFNRDRIKDLKARNFFERDIKKFIGFHGSLESSDVYDKQLITVALLSLYANDRYDGNYSTNINIKRVAYSTKFASTHVQYLSKYDDKLLNTPVEFKRENLEKMFNFLNLMKKTETSLVKHKMIYIGKDRRKYSMYNISFFGVPICSFNLDYDNFYRYGGSSASHNFVCNFIFDDSILADELTSNLLKQNIRTF